MRKIGDAYLNIGAEEYPKRDTFSHITIVYLSLSLLVLQWLYMKSSRKEAFLEGRQSVYNSFKESYDGAGEGYCFADTPPHKGQCNER